MQTFCEEKFFLVALWRDPKFKRDEIKSGYLSYLSKNALVKNITDCTDIRRSNFHLR